MGETIFCLRGERPRWWRRIYGQVPGPSPSWLQRLQAPIPSLTFGARRGRVDESDTALGAYSESARFSTTTIQRQLDQRSAFDLYWLFMLYGAYSFRFWFR